MFAKKKFNLKKVSKKITHWYQNLFHKKKNFFSMLTLFITQNNWGEQIT